MNARFVPLVVACTLMTRAAFADPAEPPPAHAPPNGVATTPPAAEPEPPSGIGLVVTGAIFTGVAGANLVTAPLCATGLVADSERSLCWGLSLGVAGAFAAVGIPLLVIGAGQRSHHADWERAHPQSSGWFVVPTPIRGGALISVTLRTY
jgi:hypothetical protein